MNIEKELKKVKRPKLPKGHKRVVISDVLALNIHDALTEYAKKMNFNATSIDIHYARFASYKPEEISAVIIKGTVQIKGELFNAQICESEMIIEDKLPDVANYLSKTVKVII